MTPACPLGRIVIYRGGRFSWPAAALFGPIDPVAPAQP